MQLAAAKNTATTEDEYLAVIRAKTAELFAAACEVGPALSLAAEGRTGRLPLVRHESRHRVPAGRRRARLWRQPPPSSARISATISARARSRCRWCWRSAAAATASATSGGARWSAARATDGDLDHAIGLMTKHRALEDTIGRAQHYGAIARDALALFPGFADEDRARRDGRLLHRADALDYPRSDRAAGRFQRSSTRRRPHPPMRIFAAQRFAAAALRRRRRGEERKAGRARTRHARETAAGEARASAASTSAITGASAIAGASRSLDCAARNCKSFIDGSSSAPGRRASRCRGEADGSTARPAGKDRLGRHRHAGIDQHRRQRRQAERRGQYFADAAHHAAARGSRQTGTSAPVARAAVVKALDRHARGRSPAPAAAAPPPHRPSRRRARPRPASILSRRKAPSAVRRRARQARAPP